MPARHAVLLTPLESPHPKTLLSRQPPLPISPLAATLMNLLASVANKRLTAGLSPLNATLTKYRGDILRPKSFSLSSALRSLQFLSALQCLCGSSVFHLPYTLPSSVCCNPCVCRSYENGRVCTNNSHSGTLRRMLAKLPSTPSMEAPVVVFRSAQFGFSATGVCPDPVGALNPSFSLDFQLSTLGLLIHYPLSFQTLADSFALSKNSTLFFSSNSGLFPKNTRGGTPHHLSSYLRRVRSLPAVC